MVSSYRTFVVSDSIFSDRPFAIAFARTVLVTPPTAQQAVTQMIHSLTPAGFTLPSDWILIADSLWANPLNLQAFSALKWRVAISAKSNCITVPEAVCEVGTDDLPLGCARTYTDKMYVVQFYHSESGLSAILTNEHAHTAPKMHTFTCDLVCEYVRRNPYSGISPYKGCVYVHLKVRINRQ